MNSPQSHILIVDDAPLIRNLLEQVLVKLGYIVSCAENGQQALELFITQRPDLILMDADMPILDGVTACRKIKQLPVAKYLPIIIVTSFVEAEWVDNAYAAGATDYITKPVNFDVLRNRIHYILQAKRAEEALFDEKEKAQITLASIGDGVITTDAKGRVDYLNPVASKLTGWDTEEARGYPLKHVFSVIEEATQQPIAFPLEPCLNEGKIIEIADNLVLIHRDGQRRFAIEDSAAPIRDRNGQVIGVVLVFHDVTENRKLTQRLAYQAQHDPMTGLFNVHTFNAHLDHVLKTAGQSGEEHALLYMDLDQFKIVNDTCGHEAGDQLLKKVAITLQKGISGHQNFRRAILARLGGDEFALLLENCVLTQALKIAEDLCERIRNFKFIWVNKQGKGVFSIGISIGLVPITAQLTNPQGMIAMADAACYAAKNAGRNNVHVYQEKDARPDIQWISLIKRGFEKNEGLFLFHQAIIPLQAEPQNGLCYEILLRVDSQEGYLARPGAFLSAAERYNLMPLLDRWVVRSFLNWLGKQTEHLDQLIFGAINISGYSFNDEDFTTDLIHWIVQSHVPAHKLCFEINETTLITNFAGTSRFIMALRELGCRFSLDDFGSGLSSFGYLEGLPIDFLKIDELLVKNCAQHIISETMIKSAHEIAHLMGLKTIAESIENEETLNKLKTIGIDYGQGYFFSEPTFLVK